MEVHRSQPPQITRKRLVAALFVSFMAVGLALVISYFFLTFALGRPAEASLRFVAILGLILLPIIGLSAYRTFKRYGPEGEAPPRSPNPRVIWAFAAAHLLVAAGLLAALYLIVHQALYSGVALAVAAAVAGHLLNRRLRQEIRG